MLILLDFSLCLQTGKCTQIESFKNSVLTEMGSCAAFCSPVCFLNTRQRRVTVYVNSAHLGGCRLPAAAQVPQVPKQCASLPTRPAVGFPRWDPWKRGQWVTAGCLTPGQGLPLGTCRLRSVCRLGSVCLGYTPTPVPVHEWPSPHILSSFP